MATTRYNVSPSFVMDIIYRMMKVFRDYCGVLNEESRQSLPRLKKRALARASSVKTFIRLRLRNVTRRAAQPACQY